MEVLEPQSPTFTLANGVQFTIRPPMMDALAWLEEEHGVTAASMTENGLGFAGGTAAVWKCAEFRGDAKVDLQGMREQMSPKLFRDAIEVLTGFFLASVEEEEAASASTSSEPVGSDLGSLAESPAG